MGHPPQSTLSMLVMLLANQGVPSSLCSHFLREGPFGAHQRLGDILLRNMRQLQVGQVCVATELA